MKIRLEGGLPFVTAEVEYQGRHLELSRVLIDTGSAGSIFSADRMADLGLLPAPNDPLRRIRGVGGTEFVFTKQVDRLDLADHALPDFRIEVGALDYGFSLDGILGMDFLHRAGVIVDLRALEIR